jgi:hypothetical protein
MVVQQSRQQRSRHQEQAQMDLPGAGGGTRPMSVEQCRGACQWTQEEQICLLAL